MVGIVDNVMDKGKDAANGKQVSGKSTTIGNRYITTINIFGGNFKERRDWREIVKDRKAA